MQNMVDNAFFEPIFLNLLSLFCTN